MDQKQQSNLKKLSGVRLLGDIEPAKLTPKTLLIVPNIDLPPRVPKVISAIALNVLIVDYKWVIE